MKESYTIGSGLFLCVFVLLFFCEHLQQLSRETEY